MPISQGAALEKEPPTLRPERSHWLPVTSAPGPGPSCAQAEGAAAASAPSARASTLAGDLEAGEGVLEAGFRLARGLGGLV